MYLRLEKKPSEFIDIFNFIFNSESFIKWKMFKNQFQSGNLKVKSSEEIFMLIIGKKNFTIKKSDDYRSMKIFDGKGKSSEGY